MPFEALILLKVLGESMILEFASKRFQVALTESALIFVPLQK
jgi:hypothetical protein